MLIVGPTASGKTTLLVTLLRRCEVDARVLLLEEIAEIPSLKPNWIRIVAQQDNIEGAGRFELRRTLEQALRLRPDFLVIGEIRGKEAEVAIHAGQTGHRTGATIHGRSTQEALSRLKALGGGELVDRFLVDHRVLIFCLERGDRPKLVKIDAFDFGNRKEIWSAEMKKASRRNCPPRNPRC